MAAEEAQAFGRALVELGEGSPEFKVYQLVLGTIQTTRQSGSLFEPDERLISIGFALTATREILKAVGRNIEIKEAA